MKYHIAVVVDSKLTGTMTGSGLIMRTGEGTIPEVVDGLRNLPPHVLIALAWWMEDTAGEIRERAEKEGWI
jgi:hypothetical protein